MGCECRLRSLPGNYLRTLFHLKTFRSIIVEEERWDAYRGIPKLRCLRIFEILSRGALGIPKLELLCLLNSSHITVSLNLKSFIHTKLNKTREISQYKPLQKPYHTLLQKITKIVIQHCILNASAYLIVLSSNRIIANITAICLTRTVCKECSKIHSSKNYERKFPLQ